MPEAALEWSSPAGPTELAWLAGPWRRAERAAQLDDRLELFRAGPGAESALARAGDPRPVLVEAASRLRAALSTSPLIRAEALLQVLRGSNPTDRSVALADLWRRATAPARVETHLRDRLAVATDLGASGPTRTRLLADASIATLDLHRRAVTAALRTRVTLVYAARTTVELAATVVALAGPEAAVLALPLAWHFLRDLLAAHADSQGH